jgi:UDP-glucose 4-epimerase
VEDTAAGLFELSKIALNGNFEAFNIGSGVDYSVIEIIEMLEGVIGESIEALSVPELQRKIDRPTQLANINKLKGRSSWKPEKSLQIALEEVWKETL